MALSTPPSDDPLLLPLLRRAEHLALRRDPRHRLGVGGRVRLALPLGGGARGRVRLHRDPRELAPQGHPVRLVAQPLPLHRRCSLSRSLPHSSGTVRMVSLAVYGAAA